MKPVLKRLHGGFEYLVGLEVEVVEGVVAELGVAAYEGADLGHHISPFYFPLRGGGDKFVTVAGKAEETNLKQIRIEILQQTVVIVYGLKLGTMRIEEVGRKTHRRSLLAAIDIGKRIAYASTSDMEHITSPGDAAQYLMGKMRNLTHECFVVVLLNTKNRVIRVKQIAEGSLTSAVVHPREVFAPAVTAHSGSILVAHNHPSGDPYPSTEDRNLTRALEDAGNVLGIPLIDHVVIGDGRYYSFREHGDL